MAEGPKSRRNRAGNSGQLPQTAQTGCVSAIPSNRPNRRIQLDGHRVKVGVEQVRVHVQRHRRLGVAEHPLHSLDADGRAQPGPTTIHLDAGHAVMDLDAQAARALAAELLEAAELAETLVYRSRQNLKHPK